MKTTRAGLINLILRNLSDGFNIILMSLIGKIMSEKRKKGNAGIQTRPKTIGPRRGIKMRGQKINGGTRIKGHRNIRFFIL
jgi:hypothetical protein